MDARKPYFRWSAAKKIKICVFLKKWTKSGGRWIFPFVKSVAAFRERLFFYSDVLLCFIHWEKEGKVLKDFY